MNMYTLRPFANKIRKMSNSRVKRRLTKVQGRCEGEAIDARTRGDLQRTYKSLPEITKVSLKPWLSCMSGVICEKLEAYEKRKA